MREQKREIEGGDSVEEEESGRQEISSDTPLRETEGSNKVTSTYLLECY